MIHLKSFKMRRMKAIVASPLNNTQGLPSLCIWGVWTEEEAFVATSGNPVMDAGPVELAIPKEGTAFPSVFAELSIWPDTVAESYLS